MYNPGNQGPDVGKFKSEFPSDFHIWIYFHAIQELAVSLLETIININKVQEVSLTQIYFHDFSLQNFHSFLVFTDFKACVTVEHLNFS